MKCEFGSVAMLIAFASSGLGMPLAAQMIHVPPLSQASGASSVPILALTFRSSQGQTEAGQTAEANLVASIARSEPTSTSEMARARVHVSASEIVVLVPGRASERILLEGRTLADVASLLHEITDGQIVAVTNYPEVSASALDPVGGLDLSNGVPLELRSTPTGPQVAIGFGAVLSLNNTEAADRSVLTDAGVQLDLIGSHKPCSRAAEEGPASPLCRLTQPFFHPDVYMQLRFGSSFNQAVMTREGATAAVDGAEPLNNADPTSILRQADQLGLSGQVDMVWPIAPNTRFSVSGGYALTYTIVDALEFAEVGEAIIDQLTEEQIAEFERQLNRTMPVSEFSITGIIQFDQLESVLIYGGGGIGRKEVIQRSLRYSVENGVVVDSTIATKADGVYEPFWRAVWGANVKGFADVRVDAVGPLRDRQQSDPLFRVYIVKAFPLTSKR